MATEWASVDDVRRRLFGDDDFSDDQLMVLLEDAEDVMLRQLPRLAEWVTSGQVRERTVVRVAVRMVMRVLRNPDGIRSITDNTGPFGGSTTFAGDHPGELYLTEEDRKELTPATEGQGRRAFSVMPNYRR